MIFLLQKTDILQPSSTCRHTMRLTRPIYRLPGMRGKIYQVWEVGDVTQLQQRRWTTDVCQQHVMNHDVRCCHDDG